MKRPYLEFDTECAINYWLLKFYFPMGVMRSFELRPGKREFTAQEYIDLSRIFQQFTLVSFNGIHYDIGMVKYAMAGASVEDLKRLNDSIIVGGLKHWDIRKHWPQCDIQGLDHVDLMEVAPGVKIGLKTYMARMHSATIQDLPFDPAEILTEEKIGITEKYCGNDLIGTRQLRVEVTPKLALREKLTDMLNAKLAERAARGEALQIMRVDLRSKSDAQMSEAMIAAELGYRPEVPYIPSGHTFKFTPAPWLNFVTPQMQAVFETCKNVDFLWSRNDEGETYLDATGKKVKTGVNMPAELKKLRVHMGRSVYKFGIGGLHSQESAMSMYSTPAGRLIDRDVGSFYPSLAILLRLFAPEIMAIYQDIYNQRMGAKPKIAELEALIKKAVEDSDVLKHLKDDLATIKTLVDGFKIVMNGWYGKLWSKYSFALNPHAGVTITINGQLSLLMYIERLEVGGVSVVSANTDGVIIYIPSGKEWYYEAVTKWWENVTGLTTEDTPYRSIHMRDVNNYVAVQPDGSVKRKGVFARSGVMSPDSIQGIHPDRDIAKDAVVKWLTDRTPIETTIRECRDIRKFVLSRKAAGGGTWRDQYLGGTVRWYYSTEGEAIRSLSKGAKVAGSDGARPIQVLPETFPDDVDFAAYESFARDLLGACGAVPK